MGILPFLTIGGGIVIGWLFASPRLSRSMDQLVNLSIGVIMLMIGLNLGLNDTIIRNFASIGLQCLIICLSALALSIGLAVITERTIVPLDHKAFPNIGEDFSDEIEQSQQPDIMSWIIPICIATGLVVGLLFRRSLSADVIDTIFNWALIVLLVGVGYSQGASREIFTYLRRLGWKFILLPLAISIGSLLGGALAGVLLGLPMKVSVLSAGGMGFYSITGAYMTQTYGLEIGTYGFLVNVLREVIAILAVPFLARINPAAPIAAGGAPSMDVVLAPITRFVGMRLSLVSIASGMVITFLIPFLLPILSWLLG
ncbi:MAG TPA: lysine exporter LysO family protein [Tissierellia bacterium]|nr:lysine exporter LysO family protein [Tissierellia bacterium]